jgi:hypothetical protein
VSLGHCDGPCHGLVEVFGVASQACYEFEARRNQGIEPSTARSVPGYGPRSTAIIHGCRLDRRAQGNPCERLLIRGDCGKIWLFESERLVSVWIRNDARSNRSKTEGQDIQPLDLTALGSYA